MAAGRVRVGVAEGDAAVPRPGGVGHGRVVVHDVRPRPLDPPILAALRAGIPVRLAPRLVDVVADVVEHVAEAVGVQRQIRRGFVRVRKAAVVLPGDQDFEVHAAGIVQHEHEICRRRENPSEHGRIRQVHGRCGDRQQKRNQYGRRGRGQPCLERVPSGCDSREPHMHLHIQIGSIRRAIPDLDDRNTVPLTAPVNRDCVNLRAVRIQTLARRGAVDTADVERAV